MTPNWPEPLKHTSVHCVNGLDGKCICGAVVGNKMRSACIRAYEESRPLMELEAHQLCPVCVGKGILPYNFYTTYQQSVSASLADVKCKRCDGTGTIGVPEVTESDIKKGIEDYGYKQGRAFEQEFNTLELAQSLLSLVRGK